MSARGYAGSKSRDEIGPPRRTGSASASQTRAAAAAPPSVAYNRFPTIVAGPVSDPGEGPAVGQQVTIGQTCRTIITAPDGDAPARLMVWTQPGDPAVDAVLDLERCQLGSTARDWTLVTDDGVYVVRPGRGCGCSNRLKRYDPWTPMTMAGPRSLR